MVLLTSHLIFAYKPGELAFVRRRPHQVSNHLAAFAMHDFSFISCHESLYAGTLPPEGYEERIPDAACAGLGRDSGSDHLRTPPMSIAPAPLQLGSVGCGAVTDLCHKELW
ncbi:MAG TPA: hypothetical protein VJT72_13635 [Pseudonocardiaceae bacterium]|nr:hypothetical protein [Pseudonocardiaceae bacterium]